MFCNHKWNEIHHYEDGPDGVLLHYCPTGFKMCSLCLAVRIETSQLVNYMEKLKSNMCRNEEELQKEQKLLEEYTDLFSVTMTGEWKSPTRAYYDKVGLKYPDDTRDSSEHTKKWEPFLEKQTYSKEVNIRTATIMETEMKALMKIYDLEKIGFESFGKFIRENLRWDEEYYSSGGFLRFHFPAILRAARRQLM